MYLNTVEKKDEKKVEIDVKEEKSEIKDEELTVEEMKALGLNEKEIEYAESQKLTKKVEVKKDGEEKKEVQEKVSEKKQEEIKRSVDEDLSPEDEQKLLKTYNKNEYSLYWENKKNRRKRQEAELARDHALIQLKAKDQLIEQLKSGIKIPEPKLTNPLDELEDESVITKRTFLESKKADDEQKRIQQEKLDREQNEKYKEVARRLQEYELEGRKTYKDFDEVINLANDLISNSDKIFSVKKNNGESDEEYESKSMAAQKKKMKVTRMVRDWFLAIDRGEDSFGYTPADMAYEIGQMHPEYGKNKEQDIKNMDENKMDDKKTEKAIENANRRMSSAAVGGGSGKRIINADELTLSQIASLSQIEFAKLPKNIREAALKGEIQ